VAKNPSGSTPSAGAAANVASGEDARGGVLNDGGVNDDDATPECRQSTGRVQATRLLRFKMTVRATVAGLGMALTLGCKSSSSRAAAQAAPSDVPVIARIRPDSGLVGPAYPIEITIEGTAFSDSSNVVMFGPVTLKDLPSRESRTRIALYVPKEMPATGEVPPAPLQPGSYDVRVRTSTGTSNAITFRLIGNTP
jgi:hypothetical protein